MEEALYLALASPVYKVNIGGAMFCAKDGVLRLPLGTAQQLDEMMVSRPDIKAALKKIDLSKAEATVEAHKKMRRAAAVQGPFASSNESTQLINEKREEQKTENLVGSAAPVVHVDNAKPLEVTEMPIPMTPKPTPGVIGQTKPKGLAAVLAAKK